MRLLNSLFQFLLFGVACLPVILTWSSGPPWWAWILSGVGVLAWVLFLGARRRARLARRLASESAEVAVDVALFGGAEMLVDGVVEIASAAGDVASSAVDVIGDIDL